MYRILKCAKLIFELFRCSPHLFIFALHKNRALIKADIKHWLILNNLRYSIPLGLIFLLSFRKPFRNLFYKRVGLIGYFLNIFCRKESSLLIHTNDIGEGLYILHGYSTAIGAKSIGKNCQINQQVTIGSLKGSPTILDNVKILSGAIVIGEITIGNNVVIGANSTVMRDVPDNSTVFPAPSKIVLWDDKQTESNLLNGIL